MSFINEEQKHFGTLNKEPAFTFNTYVQELLLFINYCGHSDFSYAAEYRTCQYADINYSVVPCRADGARACYVVAAVVGSRQFVAENSFAQLDKRVKRVTRCIHFLLFNRAVGSAIKLAV